MRTDPLGFYPLTRQGLGADYPAKVIPPTRTFDPGATIKVDGVTFQTAEFGPGESESATAYYEPVSRSLFCGDLLCNKATPALLEGHSCGWLTNLDQLERHFSQAKTCYPGHGTPADTRTLLTAQRAYLQQVRGLVHNATAPGVARWRKRHNAGTTVNIGRDGPQLPALSVGRVDPEHAATQRRCRRYRTHPSDRPGALLLRILTAAGTIYSFPTPKSVGRWPEVTRVRIATLS